MVDSEDQKRLRMHSRKKPHVVLFICDQMQFQRLGVVDGQAVTPVLDGLCREGVLFSHVYCSNAQCVPSRVSLLTGLYPHEAEVLINFPFYGHTEHIHDGLTTVGQLFRDAGYMTAYFGKRHFGFPIQPLGYLLSNNPRIPGTNSEKDRVFNEEALAFLRTYDPSHPLFLTLSYHEPHPPFELVAPFHHDYAREKLELPDSFYQDDLATKPRFQQEHAASLDHGARDAEQLRYELHCYYSMISHVDHLVGKILEALVDKDMRKDTIVLFTADHGDMMGAHRMRLKGTLPYEELYRVPVILSMPEPGPRGIIIDRLMSNTAVPGTMLDAAGIEAPAPFAERSFLPLNHSSSYPSPIEDAVFFEHYGAYWGLHPFRAVRVRLRPKIQGGGLGSTHWKYVHYYGPDQCEELYDLTQDPHEINNLASDTSSDVVWVKKELAGLVDAWWGSTGGRTFDEYEQEEYKSRQSETLFSELEY